MSPQPRAPTSSRPVPRPGAVQDFLEHVQEAAPPVDDDGWVAAKDLFDGLLADAPEDRNHDEAPDGDGGLRSFFEADVHDRHDERMRRVARRTSSGGDDGWPDHNYGPAYWRQHARRRLPDQEPQRGGLWEVDRLVGEPGAVPSRPDAATDRADALPAWRDARIGVRDDPSGWLERLERETPASATTARIVGVARGDPVERWITVCEVEETLVARPRARSTPYRSMPSPQGTRATRKVTRAPTADDGLLFGRF